MELIRRIPLMREITREARSRGRKIALVPTMGALHDGHLSLVRRARELADIVIVSVFVNPTQFGPADDFARYPRDLTSDADLCIQEGVDYVFGPEAPDMYPDGYRTYVQIEGLSEVLEGASRPGHFRGVCTVVLKLMNICRPHFGLFGQKDAQQAVIIQRLIRELNLDVEPVICPTVRADDGLALSSRNAYLSPVEREAARALWRGLARARALVADEHVDDAAAIEAAVREELEAESRARIDYIAVVDAEDLAPVSHVRQKTLVALAAWIGETRLIDNVVLKPAPRPVAAEGENR